MSERASHSPDAGFPRPGPGDTARLALVIGSVVSLALCFWTIGVRAPHIAASADRVLTGQRGKLYVPEGLLGASLSPVVGAMSGIVLAILFLNRHRLRSLLRPTGGKVIAILLLGLLLPVGLFGPLPVNGLMLLRMLPEMGIPGPDRAAAVLRIWAAILVPLAVSAVIVPPLVYGVRNRVVRAALLAGVWIAGYALQIILKGLYVGPITL